MSLKASSPLSRWVKKCISPWRYCSDEWDCLFTPVLCVCCAGMCLVFQSCLTLCDPLDCSLPRLLCPWGFSLEGVVISFSKGSSQPKDPTFHLPALQRFFTLGPPGKPEQLQMSESKFIINSYTNLDWVLLGWYAEMCLLAEWPSSEISKLLQRARE